jgi:hypothetical protein
MQAYTAVIIVGNTNILRAKAKHSVLSHIDGDLSERIVCLLGPSRSFEDFFFPEAMVKLVVSLAG